MKYKLLAMLLTAAILISPVIGFWHPPPSEEPGPPHTYLAVTLNDNYTYTFTEPTDNFCDTFTVVVGIVNVTDLFGYEFTLYWDPARFNLVSYTVETLWPGMQFPILPALDYDLSMPYEQVQVAMDPALGLNGDFKLATLTFHIQNDVCWTDGLNVHGYIYIDDKTAKASNSCSGKIDLCDSKYATWYFKPKQPEIYITPAAINCSKVGTTFEVTVMLKDIVKMTDFDVWITWSGYHVQSGWPCYDDFWTTLLYTKKENVVINEEVFPKANRTGTTTLDVFSPKCGVNNTYNYGNVHVALAMNSGFPLINGTVWLFKVTFTQCDPWYCGAQPFYTDNLDHTWTLENASTSICFYDGWISTKCAEQNGYLYIKYDVKATPATYTFIPIPGDLDGSGHTGAEDLMIEADLYGPIASWCAQINGWSPNAKYWYYDLNHDGSIDIFDLVIIAKNFCREKP
jgi:hypothetical protein